MYSLMMIKQFSPGPEYCINTDTPVLVPPMRNCKMEHITCKRLLRMGHTSLSQKKVREGRRGGEGKKNKQTNGRAQSVLNELASEQSEGAPEPIHAN